MKPVTVSSCGWFLLGDRIQTTAPDVLERLIEATCTKRHTGHLAGANPGLEKLRFLFRLAHDVRAIDHRRYEHAARSLDETGRRVGAWRKVSSSQRILPTGRRRLSMAYRFPLPECAPEV